MSCMLKHFRSRVSAVEITVPIGYCGTALPLQSRAPSKDGGVFKRDVLAEYSLVPQRYHTEEEVPARHN